MASFVSNGAYHRVPLAGLTGPARDGFSVVRDVCTWCCSMEPQLRGSGLLRNPHLELAKVLRIVAVRRVARERARKR